MTWYVYLAYFVAGVFLANGVPHFVNGISGRRFQSPFASPPTVGESSAIVNVIWGMVNFAIGFVLLRFVGDFEHGFNFNVLLVFLGALVMSLGLAWYFARVRRG
ncbi:MAG TPA: hypothetical protein EYP71_01735 [Dehalococcoidia bacterium]|nr:hypothetical protein [Dehalococcoidia bacterium]